MRLYNGCPDSELAGVWARQEAARKRLKQKAQELFGLEASARVTYFPAEGKYSACAWINGEYHELTEFCNSIEQCAEEAIECLKTMKN